MENETIEMKKSIEDMKAVVEGLNETVDELCDEMIAFSKNICETLKLMTGSQQKLSKDVVENMVAVSNLATKMTAVFLKVKDGKFEEMTLDEKRMYG
jgi:hypothetical protein